MNFYPFYIGDYSKDTMHLSWDEDMAYRRLMDVYYAREAPIPLDKQKVYRLVRATSEEQIAAVDAVLDEFFQQTPGGWINGVLDREIKAAYEERDQALKIFQSIKAERLPDEMV